MTQQHSVSTQTTISSTGELILIETTFTPHRGEKMRAEFTCVHTTPLQFVYKLN